jgi:uncharacterized protein YndB with AHSA1/START domain
MTGEGPTSYGTLETGEHGEPRLRFERMLADPQEKVWRAITEPEPLAHWFPTTIDGPRAAGARLEFVFPKGEAPPFDGEMLVFDPPSVMELRWGPDTLRLELHPLDGGGTLLILLDTLEELGKAARDGAGWHTCLDGLAALLNHKNLQDARGRWSEVHAVYAADFGLDATTIGAPEGML